MERKQISIVMGSDSDMPVMKQAAEMLDRFGIGYEIDIVSAHRTPEKLYEFASNAHHRGIVVIIAGAGGAAHLPGMVAAISPLPVIGVPIKSINSIDGWDSILSILQMPGGVPVATVALNGAKNAGILAAQIVSASNSSVRDKIIQYKQELKEQVETKSEKLKTQPCVTSFESIHYIEKNYILEGGKTTVGIESTIIKLTDYGFQILRNGIITQEELETIIPFDNNSIIEK